MQKLPKSPFPLLYLLSSSEGVNKKNYLKDADRFFEAASKTSCKLELSSNPSQMFYKTSYFY